MVEKVQKSEKEWRDQLTPEQYRVARERETEKRFSHPEHNAKVTGVYHCVCCGAPLFKASTKFDSGTGWPSFLTPVLEEAIETRPDLRYEDDLTEVVCVRCDAHLGHVFEDGPEPTGLRYCINGVCMNREDGT
jgi:peptide-methionine (R)-S-oxide reductase